MTPDFQLSANLELSSLIRTEGINHFRVLLDHIQSLPYGRNANRSDLSLVFKEKKGTCSSKHAFLKKVIEENEIVGIELLIGIYKMTIQNTPGIGSYMEEAGLSYLPEAHCYLKYLDKRIDITNSMSDFDRISDAILKEVSIQAEQVTTFKVNLHKNYIKDWIDAENIQLSFEEVWSIREKCIANLSFK